ncbi:similar to MFS monocarboxylate transporter [Plenodomus lingam JN3]|uniref:Similar to MFS monocarboxylate transporter n=1 Tax=Leptosphaeria maculans (strain JN3 / isolate v23.1.3 / race Av1-4-5-6-7-8) TaxID=985895 RepID=E5A0E9_LEPMJ|nr:similar to MFS monocarboxylate transporter [Plenodomus lingam JN3]CBX97009.1 similar to MFS monocarboxylate transporter [Plenodomus lingam JN3]
MSTPSSSTASAYLERGTRAYAVVLGAWLLLLPASGLLNSTGIFQARLVEHELRGRYAEGEVAWIFSVFAFLVFFGGVGVGPAFDKYGEKILVRLGAGGLVCSLLVTSFCKEYYQFLLSFGILGGTASSLLWTTSIATLGHWFHQNRALATGLATTAGGFGGVLYPILFHTLVPRLGFPWTLRCFALLSGCCLLAGSALLRTRLPRPTHTATGLISLEWSSFRDPRFVLTMAAIFVLDWAVLVPPAYVTLYARSRGLHDIAPHVLALLNAASIFGRGLPGPIADQLGRFNVMILCSAVCTASVFGLWLRLGSSVAGIVVFAIVYGFFSGPAYSLTPVCVAQLCRTEEYASRYGTAYGVVSLATLAGVPLSGSILGAGGGGEYDGLIGFCGAMYAVSTVLFVVARGVSKGWKVGIKF